MSGALSQADRRNMREVAERVMRERPNPFSDAHLMAAFVVNLLDNAPERVAEKLNKREHVRWIRERATDAQIEDLRQHRNEMRDEIGGLHRELDDERSRRERTEWMVGQIYGDAVIEEIRLAVQRGATTGGGHGRGPRAGRRGRWTLCR